MGGNLGYTVAPGHELRVNLMRIESRNWYDGGGFNAVGGADVGNDLVTEVIAVESRNRLTDNWRSTLRLASRRTNRPASAASRASIQKQQQFLWQNDVQLPLGNH